MINVNGIYFNEEKAVFVDTDNDGIAVYLGSFSHTFSGDEADAIRMVLQSRQPNNLVDQYLQKKARKDREDAELEAYRKDPSTIKPDMLYRDSAGGISIVPF